MKRSPGPRIPSSNLSESVQQRLNGYALAAAAAGVGLLALSSPCEAEIIYTPAHTGIGRFYFLDLNHDGISDFTLQATESCDENRCISWLGVYSAPQPNAIAGNGWAAVLWPGDKIGPKRRSWGAIGIERASTSSNSRSGFQGAWANGGKGFKNHYLGLKFLIDGRLHYGWARLTTTGGWPRAAVLTGYAYETIPGKAIVAGRTKGPDDDIAEESSATPMPAPEPATLGALAMGAPGLSIWRREDWARALALR